MYFAFLPKYDPSFFLLHLQPL